MHAQIVTFHLDGVADADFRRMCDDVAPAIADTPGLIAKLWLADPSSNTYAGVYTWRDRRAMEDYLASDLFAAIKATPAFADLTSKDFAVVEGPTRVTHGLAAVPACHWAELNREAMMTRKRPGELSGIDTLLPMWEGADVVSAFARWHPGAEVFYRPVSEALLAEAGVQPGTRLLDVGTGTGIPSLLAAEVVGPVGTVVATDPSAGLLAAAEANAREANLGNLSFHRAAAEALPFPDGSFDAAVSQFGLMFVADLPRALGEIRRVLRPGGRAAFLAWGPYERNPFTAVFQEVARPYRAAAAPPGWSGSSAPAPDAVPDPRHPFRFAEPGTLAAALRAAAFVDVREETREVTLRLPEAEPICRFWLDANRDLEAALPEERRQAFRNEVRAAYRRFATAEGVEIPAAAVVASGASPSPR